jgi:mono/diheme cytochrome c family protein
MRSRALCGALLAAASLGIGCRQDMHDQPRLDPLQGSDFFADGRGARPLVAGTVARGQLREDEHLYTGKVDGRNATTLPVPVTRALLERGRERYDIFCSPCHDRVGTGNGMVVRRGLRRAASLHDERLRGETPGYFFDVITNGFGAMSSYAAQVPAEDRWAIVAYVRALQLSQRAALDDLPEGERTRLAGAAP